MTVQRRNTMIHDTSFEWEMFLWNSFFSSDKAAVYFDFEISLSEHDWQLNEN